MEEIDGESAEQRAAINLRRNSEQSLDDSVEIIEENITTIDLTTATPTPSSLHLYDADDVFTRALPAITTTTTTTTLMQQQPSAISSVDGSNISSSIDIQQYINSILTNSAVNSNTSNDIQQYINTTFPNSAAGYTALQIKCEKPSTSTQALKDIGSSSAEASAAAAAAAILLDNQQPSGSASSGPSTSTSTPVVLECPICLQTCIHPARLPCGHIFCFLCVKGVAYKNRRCAMCRREIPAEFLDHPQLVNGIEDICSTKATEDGYQWFYEGRNGWWKYDERTAAEIEQAYQMQLNLTPKLCFTTQILICGKDYVIDFPQMVQYPLDMPYRRRSIRRELSMPVKGVAGIYANSNKRKRQYDNSNCNNNNNNNDDFNDAKRFH